MNQYGRWEEHIVLGDNHQYSTVELWTGRSVLIIGVTRYGMDGVVSKGESSSVQNYYHGP